MINILYFLCSILYLMRSDLIYRHDLLSSSVDADANSTSVCQPNQLQKTKTRPKTTTCNEFHNRTGFVNGRSRTQPRRYVQNSDSCSRRICRTKSILALTQLDRTSGWHFVVFDRILYDRITHIDPPSEPPHQKIVSIRLDQIIYCTITTKINKNKNQLRKIKRLVFNKSETLFSRQ